MIFSEPERTQFDLHFMLGRVPVRVHPLFWLVAVLLTYGQDIPPLYVLIWVAAVFLALLVHEMGHALAFRYYGLPSHIVLHSFGGLAIPEASYGRREQTPLAKVIIALAGPLAGFLFAALIILGLYLAGVGATIPIVGSLKLNLLGTRGLPSKPLVELLGDLLQVNINWGLLNLLPIYPLDGGHVFRELLVRFNSRDGDRQSLMLSVLTAAGMAVLAMVRWRSMYSALMFGYLAYMSFSMLQQFGGFGRRR